MATATDEIEVRSPYSGEVVGRAPKSGAADTRQAVDAASRALESPLPAHERAAILDRVASLLRERREDMARTICAEAGKPIKTARVEASRAVSTYTFAAVEARKLAGDVEQEAGLPDGWLSVLVGPSAEIGDVLVEDERVRMITFTGSSGVGWGIAERAAKKRVRLELGNSTPVVVAADADLDLAATKLAANAFSFAGQSCISVQRIYVERPALDGFLERFLPKVEALVVGDPADEATDVGPVIDADARTRIAEWVEEAQAAGAKLLAGSTDADPLGAIVLAEAPESARVVCDEVFGPVCVVNAVDSLEAAYARANGTDYGLQAGIFTGSIATALTAAQALEFGGVTVNEAPTFRADQMPYGGVKGSGNTKEGPAFTIREMTEERLVVLQA